MRLGQLSRKINIRSSEIVSFLASQNVAIDDSVNTKVNDDLVRLVVSKFAPGTLIAVEEIIDEAPTEQPVPEIAHEPSLEVAVPEVTAIVEAEEISAEHDAEREEEVSRSESGEQTEFPDVIKAPKVELQGLKIIGKIELPTPKKKEPVAPPVEENTEENVAAKVADIPKGDRHDKRRNGPRKEKRNDRPRKNPIALQREREEREALERKKEQARREKEKRTQYYQKRVKPSAPIKPVRMVDEPLVDMSHEAPDAPKTLWGKFVRWLTT